MSYIYLYPTGDDVSAIESLRKLKDKKNRPKKAAG